MFSEVGALDVCSYGDLGSGSSQPFEEGARSPKPFSEYGRILPYAYAKVVLEAEGRAWCEHHAVLFGEPVGKLEGWQEGKHIGAKELAGNALMVNSVWNFRVK